MMMHVAHDTKLAAVDLNLLVALKALLNERHVTRAARQLGRGSRRARTGTVTAEKDCKSAYL
jgi:hypothetical protein